MRMRHRNIIVLVIVLAAPSMAWACYWDYDTLRQERARFPTVLEVITGKFLRHSKEFYEWRIKDRKTKLSKDDSVLTNYDDLAVAYQMTGQSQMAIDTALAELKMAPDRYETLSNLGTFYVIVGDFENGLPYIDQALAINPNAHFGRERYQKWLVEYAITQRVDGELKFPMRRKRSHEQGDYNDGFREFLLRQLNQDRLSTEDWQSAVKGVVGMLRFANYRNPLLLEVLGDLLVDVPERETDAKHLAARAYLKASYEVDDATARQSYRDLAENALRLQTGENLKNLEVRFKSELAEADAWYQQLHQRELDWIRSGKDVETEFNRLYQHDPRVQERRDYSWQFVEGGVTLVLIVVGIAFLYYRRRRRSQPDASHSATSD